SPAKPSSGRSSPRRARRWSWLRWSMTVTTSVAELFVSTTPRSRGRSSTMRRPDSSATRSATSRRVAGSMPSGMASVISVLPAQRRTSGPEIGAAAEGTDRRMRFEVVPGGPQGRLPARLGGPLEEQVGEAGDEGGVGAGRRHAGDLDADLGGGLHGLDVEVVDDLHVVGDEAEGHEHDVGDALVGELADPVVDVRLEPRRLRRPRAGA